MNKVVAPKENTIEYPNLRIFIPFTDIQPATLISLIGYNYTPIEVQGEYGYSNYFKNLWKEEAFINIEHDVIVWPGALESIWECPQDLCVYNYHLPIHRKTLLDKIIPLGCIKISQKFIKDNPNLWDTPVEWSYVDQKLSKFTPHQHFPGIVNANPDLLGFVNIKEDK